MAPREYGQSCSLACALDHVGERWTMLIVRELSLGPLRFSDLVHSVGGAPTDVLTKRLRELEQHGLVQRRELNPPAAASVYELTELGRGLEGPMIELGRWGMGLQTLGDVLGLTVTSLPNALRVVLDPPADFTLTLGLECEGLSFTLSFKDGWITASRGAAANPDLVISVTGAPIDAIAALVAGGEDGIEVEGDRSALEALRGMAVIPERLREEALAQAPAA